nr:hypothetical protein [Tanacetum cinerariifolium]
MKDLRFLCIEGLAKIAINWKFDKVSEFLPSSLRFLRWVDFPFLSLPSTFQDCSTLGRWRRKEFEMPAESLKLEHLDLSRSMLKIIHLGNTPNLERLKIKGCNDLALPSDLGSVKCLKELNLHLRNTPNLKTLELQSCRDLVEFQMLAESLKLEHLDLGSSKLTNLRLGNTSNLKKLILDECNDLVEFQMPAESLKLEHLDLSCSKLTNLYLGNTLNLKTLGLKRCYNLVEFQMPAESLKLEHLDLSYSNFKTIHLGSTPNLERLMLFFCDHLVWLPELGSVKCLKELNIRRTGIRCLPQSIFQLKGLRIIGSAEIFESYGLSYKIQTSYKGKSYE